MISRGLIMNHMTQKIIFKQKQVTVQEPKTLKSVLEEIMLEQGLELRLLKDVANTSIISVDNIMTRNLSLNLNAGAKVILIPAIKAG